ncbi:phosphate/phosphite/phosphonate ABC transporter substrate-binding protein [Frigoriglobus tundricola]|uniref:Phosphonate ABC transporter phosphate-binding periplasmic component n=1 Tax=Frigoriglobus tundricola TaxID=2774151 RepID=A0A6M5YNM6_9BACT|nr:phosphate/phosphite/phosphonate ABC transporter substrate-binding protein [Frigoriglobus tundricola]QJW95657.1 Phosphonate ABC transporter phosphate-binding periplasmic component [Frigoriglobus tundricola]
MSETVPAWGRSESEQQPQRKSSWAYTLAVVVLLVVGATGYFLYVESQNPPPPPVDELAGLREYLAHLSGHQKLADGYVDTDPQDLVADTPKDPAKWVTVNGALMFSVVATDDPVLAAEQWRPLMAALGAATGKNVKYADDVRTVEDQLAAVRDGRLHVTAFNTGAVPGAVNTAGFVPLFAPADARGRFGYEMEILVRADSPIKTPADLKGKTVGFVALSSNSGAKAPLVALKDEFRLLPGRDYRYAMTGDHVRSVKELVAGRHDAVCVANDLVRRAEAAGEVDKTRYRSIYTSRSFPPLCFGVPHQLAPDLRAKVTAAFAAFKFDPATPVGKRYTVQGKTGFAPVNYEKDWEFVRKIDEALSHLLDAK